MDLENFFVCSKKNNFGLRKYFRMSRKKNILGLRNIFEHEKNIFGLRIFFHVQNYFFLDLENFFYKLHKTTMCRSKINYRNGKNKINKINYFLFNLDNITLSSDKKNFNIFASPPSILIKYKTELIHNNTHS